jgi:GT2 family glycosyltransferase
MPSQSGNVRSASDGPTVLIAILNWNLPQETIRCVESCLATTYRRASFLLIDNGSSEAVVEGIRAWATSRLASWRTIRGPQDELPTDHELVIAFHPTNLGYAGGNNIALRCALTWGIDWVLVLNNDATIPPDYVEALVSVGTRSPDAGMIGSRQSYPAEYSLRPSCGVRISYNLGAYPFWRYGCAAGTRRVNFAPGNSVLMRTAMLRRIGLFDERYFLYSEDVDLSYRAWKAGWDILLNLDVTAAQGISSSLGGRRSPTYYYYLTRNTFIFLSERLKGWRRWVSLAAFSSMIVVRSVSWLVIGRRQNARAAALGFRHFVANRYGQAPDL